MGLIGMFFYSVIDMGMFEFFKKFYWIYYLKYMGCYEDDVNLGNIVIGIIGVLLGVFGVLVVYLLNVVCIWL